MVNPRGFWVEAQIKMLLRIKAWMYLRHLTSHLGKSRNTNFTFNRLFFAWMNQKLHIQLEMTFSIVNPSGFWFEAQIKILWRRKAWMYLLQLTSRLGKSQNHQSQLESSVFCLSKKKITYWTENDIFYGQPSWFLFLRKNENVMKDKSLNVPATLDVDMGR